MAARAAALAFDLSGLRVRVQGLPRGLAERLAAEWNGFAAAPDAPAWLDLACDAAPEAADDSPYAPREMRASFARGTARYCMREGQIEVPSEGPARLRLESTTGERQFLTLVNLASAAFAWRLPSRGGALLHAAGIVWNERAFVLVGPEGSGKTTWALLAKSAGATVLSDDVVAVDPSAGGRYEVLATPFRSRQHGTSKPGRWPLAALLLPEHGDAARLRPVGGLLVRARLMANLPFFAEAAAHDERPHRLVELLATAAPARILTFQVDPGFVALLASFAP